MAGLDDEEYARDDAARAEEEWGSEFEREAEERAQARQELAELRTKRDAVHLIGGCWEQGGGAEPVGYVATVDGEVVPLQVDASPVVNEALRRQAAGSAAVVVRAVVVVRAAVVVEAAADFVDAYAAGSKDQIAARRALMDAVEQLRGATAEPRPGTCRICANWIETDEETPDGTRLCRLRPDLPARTGDSSCTDGYDSLDEAETDTDPAPQLPGVEISGNLVRPEGDQ